MFDLDADRTLPDLTDEQQRAVAHDGSSLLIVAGAGTGKTTTLSARLAHLVANGVPPERIMLLTFSRRAATELLSRAEQWAGHDRLRGAWGGTFHAVANRLLRRYGRSVGIDPDFTLLDQGDQADLLALVRDELSSDSTPQRRRARKELLASALSRVVNTRQPLDVVLRQHHPWVADQADELRATYGAYIARKRERHLVDYDDLLSLWRALVQDPEAGPLVAGRFDHVLVDEYQDTNALQADVLAAMAAAGATITAVGDDAQAIYGFRGGTVRNILDFPTRFDAEVVALTRSHRSTPEVVTVANRIWDAASERHDKELVATRASGTRPSMVTAGDEHAEARGVCERLLESVERGIPLRRQAVLFRTGHHADLLEVELTVRRIPFVKFGGLKFLEAAHVKDLLALCRVAVNPRDDLAWFRVLQRIDGVGPGIARRVVTALDAADGSLGRVVDSGVVPPRSADEVAGLAAAVAAAADGDLATGERIDACRAWLDPHLDRFGDGAARRADLARLSELAAGTPDLETFLTELTLDPPASTGDLAGPPHLDDDVLTLSTIHSAKGGEWDIVHLIHAADGNLPSDLSTGDPEQLEEERRLLYVAVTRARDELHVHVPLRFHHHRNRLDDAHSTGQRSRFLTADVVDAMDEVVAVPGPAPAGDGSPSPLPRVRDAVAAADAELAALLG
ncbi:ATP-dependent helicase [Acidimicrobiia bacterium EGI L10123]|uniref:ATP-dependent helicase n=1 Tax=Salinilacustrithrix flava TaxID=2957203 RepID=UPI003D7C2520|nr:ATP-dependent helicase [Acidimicrobiia bacterium EGI L10123]